MVFYIRISFDFIVSGECVSVIAKNNAVSARCEERLAVATARIAIKYLSRSICVNILNILTSQENNSGTLLNGIEEKHTVYGL